MYGDCNTSTAKLIKYIRREKPDIVHLQCINGHFVNMYKLIGWLNKNKIKTVLTLHAELMHTANCAHAFDCEKWKTGCGKCPIYKRVTGAWLRDGTAESWKRMKKAFDGFENIEIVSVSPWLMERAKQSPILGDKKHSVILNGLDSAVFYRRAENELPDLKKYGDKKVIFHVTANFSDSENDLKGGRFVIDLAKRLKDKAVILVASGKCSLNGELPENIVLLGNISDQNLLAQYYSAADLSLITSKRETFSMPVAESLSCGTPVVGFEAGAPEQITIPGYSDFVAYGDMDALEGAARKWLDTTVDRDALSQEAVAKYDKKQMVKEYIELYYKMKGAK